ncbi:hypothetical protein DFQ28_005524 [Apophysomyces sp. BC1034]|nr:hypothetical protein DFQ30_006952 [Apophysomyces sp. BC1015]KAG0177683.1 hypothetical protein DFQ29_004538 [Apophysomyces sp. BC1021]KAG0187990.1 hypothetical protein DFQ28_005524 [Apophysomyces sp. BC1034]
MRTILAYARGSQKRGLEKRQRCVIERLLTRHVDDIQSLKAEIAQQADHNLQPWDDQHGLFEKIEGQKFVQVFGDELIQLSLLPNGDEHVSSGSPQAPVEENNQITDEKNAQKKQLEIDFDSAMEKLDKKYHDLLTIVQERFKEDLDVVTQKLSAITALDSAPSKPVVGIPGYSFPSATFGTTSPLRPAFSALDTASFNRFSLIPTSSSGNTVNVMQMIYSNQQNLAGPSFRPQPLDSYPGPFSALSNQNAQLPSSSTHFFSRAPIYNKMKNWEPATHSTNYPRMSNAHFTSSALASASTSVPAATPVSVPVPQSAQKSSVQYINCPLVQTNQEQISLPPPQVIASKAPPSVAPAPPPRRPAPPLSTKGQRKRLRKMSMTERGKLSVVVKKGQKPQLLCRMENELVALGDPAEYDDAYTIHMAQQNRRHKPYRPQQPTPADNSRPVYIKEGYPDGPHFVLRKDGKEINVGPIPDVQPTVSQFFLQRSSRADMM